MSKYFILDMQFNNKENNQKLRHFEDPNNHQKDLKVVFIQFKVDNKGNRVGRGNQNMKNLEYVFGGT